MGHRDWSLGTAVLAILLSGPLMTLCDAAAERPSVGHDLYQRLSCQGCHALHNQGGAVGPALDGVASRLTRGDLETQILTPRQRQADSRMPSFAFVKPSEIQALLDFLQSLK